MTRVNQKDKSSVSLCVCCYSAGDRHSPQMQTLSLICQRHNNLAGRPHLHHLANNKCNWWKYWLLYHGKEGCPSWPFLGKSHFLQWSSLTFSKHLLEMRTSRISINTKKIDVGNRSQAAAVQYYGGIYCSDVVILLVSNYTSHNVNCVMS